MLAPWYTYKNQPTATQRLEGLSDNASSIQGSCESTIVTPEED